MKGFVVPTVDLFHNLTKDAMYEIIKVERDSNDTFHYYFYDDNDKLTILVKKYETEDSFEIYWLPMGA